ncbi:hypothetical protein NP233_g8447 [Leucocoprinus birnbaumii]|uniref:Uncharacterized protein n=1 Tax=Leucocoprinus birnbaumii TaxID=56174 RepID=A0AAD5VP00_9AGAR|nr:hypothetical protein NP233_g8447 [Leucocoprinus birnbaumii]
MSSLNNACIAPQLLLFNTMSRPDLNHDHKFIAANSLPTSPHCTLTYDDVPPSFKLPQFAIIYCWGKMQRISLSEEDKATGDSSIEFVKNERVLRQFTASPVAGNAVFGSMFYMLPPVAAAGGIVSPISLTVATLILFLWRPIMEELAEALPICGGPYTYLISPKWIDHLYSWGILTLNYLFYKELLPIEQILEIDNKCIEQLTCFGISNLCPQLPQGWRHPTKDDLLQIHLSFELLHSHSCQDSRKAPYWVKAGIAFPFHDLSHCCTTAIPSSTDSIPMDITTDQIPADKTTSTNWANKVEAHLESMQPQDKTLQAHMSTAPPTDRPDSPTKATPTGLLSLTVLKK